MRALEFIRDHVTFKLPYDFSYQMKTPLETCEYDEPCVIYLRIEVTKVYEDINTEYGLQC